MKVDVKLSSSYYLMVAFFCVMWGLGLILHFFVNNRVFPRTLDSEGVTTRSGKRYLWSDLVDWERNRMVVGGPGGARLTGNVTLLFNNGKVRIGTGVIENLDEVLAFLSNRLGENVVPG